MPRFEHSDGKGLNFKDGLEEKPVLGDLSPEEFKRVIKELNKKDQIKKEESI